MKLSAWLTLVIGLLPTAGLNAQSPRSTHARVDVIAETDQIELADGAWLFGADHYIKRMSWLTDRRKESTYFGEFAILPFAAPPTVLTFAPKASGKVRVELKGQWQDRGDGQPQRLNVHWIQCAVSGARVVSPSFKPATSWINQPLELTLEVTRGVAVYIKLAAQAEPRVDPKSARKSELGTSRAHRLVKHLRRGINVSNWLEVPPDEDWGDNSCDRDDFALMKAQGFDHIRLPVGWHHYTSPVNGLHIIDQSVYRKVDRVVQQATAVGLAVIINVHHYDEFVKNPAQERGKLLAIWQQLAAHYADQPERVFFEIINEPSQQASSEVMNDVFAEIIATIRQTNPDRGIVVGPAEFNSVDQLRSLKLPTNDRALIVSVHNYDPYHVTHQGAPWAAPGVRKIRGIRFPGPPRIPVTIPADADNWTREWLKSFNQVSSSKFGPSSEIPIERMIEIADGWSRRHDRPVHLSEFGVLKSVDSVSRSNYYRAVRQRAEKRGIGWAIWDWKADFAYWDTHRGQSQPGMAAALFGR